VWCCVRKEQIDLKFTIFLNWIWNINLVQRLNDFRILAQYSWKPFSKPCYSWALYHLCKTVSFIYIKYDVEKLICIKTPMLLSMTSNFIYPRFLQTVVLFILAHVGSFLKLAIEARSICPVWQPKMSQEVPKCSLMGKITCIDKY
jgi:hypothetical protein